jgi:CO/xanthine dehydrogenase FAD-binding subunit
VLFGGGDVPHVSLATAALLGERTEAARLGEVGRAAAAELDPHADLHATVEYRRRVAAGLGVQALARAAARAESVS